MKSLRNSFHLELFLTARLQLSPGEHVSDSSAALSSINFCGRFRTTSFCVTPGNSTHSSHTVLCWHAALIDAGLQTNVHNSCYCRCRIFPFIWSQETPPTPTWPLYTGILLGFMLFFEPLFTTAFHRYVSKAPAGLQAINAITFSNLFLHVQFVLLLSSYVFNWFIWIYCLMPENDNTFCKVWTKKTLQKFIIQFPTSVVLKLWYAYH